MKTISFVDVLNVLLIAPSEWAVVLPVIMIFSSAEVASPNGFVRSGGRCLRAQPAAIGYVLG